MKGLTCNVPSLYRIYHQKSSEILYAKPTIFGILAIILNPILVAGKLKKRYTELIEKTPGTLPWKPD
jgi:hypothetical protein